MARDGTPGYLVSKVNELIESLASGRSLSIILPAVLTSKGQKEPTQERNAAAPTKRKVVTDEPGNTRTATPAPKPSEPHINKDPCLAWLAKDGEDYLDLFPGREPGSKPWPRFVDPRLPKRNRKIRKVPLCAKFQMMKSGCRQGCPMAHVCHVDMDAVERAKCDDIFKEAIRSRA